MLKILKILKNGVNLRFLVGWIARKEKKKSKKPNNKF